MTFVILASVIMSRLIIEEYRSNTITLLFTYPISRKKLMISKLMIVAGFIFTTIILSNLFIGSLFYIVDSYANVIPGNLTLGLVKSQLITLFLSAVSSTGIGLIPLYFGMRKKSTPATVISAVLLVTFINSDVDGFSLFNNIIAVPLAFAAVGVFIAYLSFRKIENMDVN
ncbi:ABC transporter permease [Bacillus songklensis]|uniref:ABC transporter permease n=1 Tax=Bacillus songklensis TaxID=1069116 RepID=UPI00366D1306